MTGINQKIASQSDQMIITQILKAEIGDAKSYIFNLNTFFNNPLHFSQIFERGDIGYMLANINAYAKSNAHAVMVVGGHHEGSMHCSQLLDNMPCIDCYITVFIECDKSASRHHILTGDPRIIAIGQ